MLFEKRNKKPMKGKKKTMKFRTASSTGVCGLFLVLGSLFQPVFAEPVSKEPKEVAREVVGEVFGEQALYDSGMSLVKQIVRSRDLLRKRLQRLKANKNGFAGDQQELKLLVYRLGLLFPYCDCGVKPHVRKFIEQLQNMEHAKIVRDSYYWHTGKQSLFISGVLGIIACAAVGAIAAGGPV